MKRQTKQGAVVENQREDLLRRVRIYINEDHLRQSSNNVTKSSKC